MILIHAMKHIRYAIKSMSELWILPKQLAKESIVPGKDRKSLARIIMEQIIWIIRFGEYNRYYFAYEFDRRKNRVESGEYLALRRYKHLRRRHNIIGKKEVNLLLLDKHVFSLYFGDRGLPVVRTKFIIRDGEILAPGESERKTPEEFLAPGTDVYCKPVDGQQGMGVFNLKVDASGLVSIDGELIPRRGLMDRFSGAYIVQDRIRQHPLIGQINPETLNTLRVVSLRIDGDARIHSAILRTGRRGEVCDNWHRGSVPVRIDLETGALFPLGRMQIGSGGWVPAHPDSGAVFSEYTIPHFKEVEDVVTKAHRALPEIRSIGWDIAITEDGPVLVEGNQDWDLILNQIVVGGMKDPILRSFRLRGAHL